MVKSVSTNLGDHIAGGNTSLATCYRITTESNIITLTSHQLPLTISGRVYQPYPITNSGVRTQTGTRENTVTLQIAMTDIITRDDVVNNLYSRALVEIFSVNYNSIADGELFLFTGRISKAVPSGNDACDFVVSGLMRAASYKVGERYSPSCRNDIGDLKCGLQFSSNRRIHTLSRFRRGQHVSFLDDSVTAPMANFVNGDFSSPIGTGWTNDEGSVVVSNSDDFYAGTFTGSYTRADFTVASDHASITQTFTITEDVSSGTKAMYFSTKYGAPDAAGNTEAAPMSGRIQLTVLDANGLTLIARTHELAASLLNDAKTLVLDELEEEGLIVHLPDNAATVTIRLVSDTPTTPGVIGLAFVDTQAHFWDNLLVDPFQKYIVRSVDFEFGKEIDHVPSGLVDSGGVLAAAALGADFVSGAVTFETLSYNVKTVVVQANVPQNTRELQLVDLNTTARDVLTGEVQWVKGQNSGSKNILRTYDETTFVAKLYENEQFPILAGDVFILLPICDKTLDYCHDKYKNVINMRAEPHLPGKDRT